MTRETPTVVIIIGITGDLAQRKLLPAIGQLAQADVLPDQFKIVGITRQADVNKDSLVPQSTNARFIREHLDLLQVNLAETSEYQRLTEYLKEIDKQFGATAQRLFYLSIPPQVSQSIIEQLGTSGLAKAPGTKLLLEKPFGVDLASAQDLVAHIDKYFTPEQVYRIDHYLAKEMAQNMLVFREENALFRQTWNSTFIDSILITASEQISIEGRANFYEQTGALRDVVQSHLLQIAALTLAPAMPNDVMQNVPQRRLAALKQLHFGTDTAAIEQTKRGQYRNYRQEVGNAETTTETFVALTLQSDDPTWSGVPITLATGKALHEKSTEVRVRYKRNESNEANELILRLQPNEGAELHLWTKRPGYDEKVEQRALTFSYKEDERLPEAYERVFLDAIRSDHRLFASGEEVLETWRILDPLQRAWNMSDGSDLIMYDQGSSIADLAQ
ncbi:MAG TPA: glucose-6-phosphate dehydrogenase [Candidatus Saccharimonadales bacterium]|nr:glucose-6-phosphate dehydrogenase [Candidatus Saccharimonadales bacterium]